MLTRFCCPKSINVPNFLWEFLSPISSIASCVQLLVFYFLLKGIRDFWFEDLVSERRKIEAGCPRSRQWRDDCGLPVAPKICCRASPQNQNAVASSLKGSVYSGVSGSVRGPLSMASSQGHALTNLQTQFEKSPNIFRE